MSCKRHVFHFFSRFVINRNCLILKDNEKRRAQEEKQAREAEREKNNKKKRKDGVRTTLQFKEDECIVDKLLTEIRQGFPLKKRRRTSVDNAKDTLESTPSSICTSNEGIVI